jgi:hypothetical protein
MNYMRGFTDLKEQKQLHYESACQKDAKAGRYKGRQIPEFNISLGQSKFRSRHDGNSNLRMGERSFHGSISAELILSIDGK